jgi:hypothetical protein
MALIRADRSCIDIATAPVAPTLAPFFKGGECRFDARCSFVPCSFVSCDFVSCGCGPHTRSAVMAVVRADRSSIDSPPAHVAPTLAPFEKGGRQRAALAGGFALRMETDKTTPAFAGVVLARVTMSRDAVIA